MSKTMKVLLATVTLSSIIFLGTLTWISTKINDTDMKDFVVAELERVFPKSQVTLSSLDYSINLSMEISLEDLVITDRSGELLSVEKASVSLPLSSLFNGGGRFNIELEKPIINLITMAKNKSNWSMALDKSLSLRPNKRGTQDAQEVGLSRAVIDARVNLRLSEALVNYRDNLGDNRKIDISQLVFKNLSFSAPTAFEASIAVTEDTELATFRSLVIGEFELADYLAGKDMPIQLMLQLNELMLPKISRSLPDAKINLNLVWKENGGISGELKGASGKNLLAAQVRLIDQGLSFSDVNFDLEGELLADIMNLPLKFSSGSIIKTTGNLIYDFKKGITPNLKISSEKEIQTSLAGLEIEQLIEGMISTNDYSLSSSAKLLGGDMILNLAGKLRSTDKKISNANVKIQINGSKLEKEFIRSLIYDNRSSLEGIVLAGINTDVELEWKKVQIGEDLFNGSGVFLLRQNSLATQKLEFRYGDGSGDLTQLTKVKGNKWETIFDFNVNRVGLASILPFMPKRFDRIEGDLDGSIKGTVTSEADNKRTYDLNVRLAAFNGRVKDVDVAKRVNMLLSEIPGWKANYQIENRFDSLRLKGKFKDDVFKIRNAHFRAYKNKASIQGSGRVYPNSEGSNSEIYFDIKDRSGQLRPKLGVSNVPVRLEGFGKDLDYDPKFTMKRLINSSVGQLSADEIKRLEKRSQKMDLGQKLLEGVL